MTNTKFMRLTKTTFKFHFLLQNILKAVRKITEGRTSIFIAHRLSTIIDADKIYVLMNGKIIESGTHYDLINNPSSYYTELWINQNKSSFPHK